MFVPIESAFIAGVANDNKLWEEAWQKNVLLVSPTSLLFVVRIVANLWTQDNQKRNFQDIARRGAALYDKLVGFVEDLKTVGQRLERANSRLHTAPPQLSRHDALARNVRRPLAWLFVRRTYRYVVAPLADEARLRIEVLGANLGRHPENFLDRLFELLRRAHRRNRLVV